MTCTSAIPTHGIFVALLANSPIIFNEWVVGITIRQTAACACFCAVILFRLFPCSAAAVFVHQLRFADIRGLPLVAGGRTAELAGDDNSLTAGDAGFVKTLETVAVKVLKFDVDSHRGPTSVDAAVDKLDGDGCSVAATSAKLR
jgi:hypothetical protein